MPNQWPKNQAKQFNILVTAVIKNVGSANGSRISTWGGFSFSLAQPADQRATRAAPFPAPTHYASTMPDGTPKTIQARSSSSKPETRPASFQSVL
jgi:hypothetical protein